jgi:hypothetical protein
MLDRSIATLFGVVDVDASSDTVGPTTALVSCRGMTCSTDSSLAHGSTGSRCRTGLTLCSALSMLDRISFLRLALICCSVDSSTSGESTGSDRGCKIGEDNRLFFIVSLSDDCDCCCRGFFWDDQCSCRLAAACGETITRLVELAELAVWFAPKTFHKAPGGDTSILCSK